jgi:hypothetical protein
MARSRSFASSVEFDWDCEKTTGSESNPQTDTATNRRIFAGIAHPFWFRETFGFDWYFDPPDLIEAAGYFVPAIRFAQDGGGGFDHR